MDNKIKISVVDGLIKEYALIGDIDNGITYTFGSVDELEAFKDNFKADVYRYADGDISLNDAYIDTSENVKAIKEVEIKIANLKHQLSETDYIFIKVSEAQILDTDIPYDESYLLEVSVERDAIRKQINDLQTQIVGS